MVTGTKELITQVRNIKKTVRNATRQAAFAGARVYRQGLRSTAPTVNSVAKRSIVAKRVRVPREGTGVARVGFNGPAFYLQILNVGAKNHDIVAKYTAKTIDPKTRKVIGKHPRKRLTLAVSRRPGGPLFYSQFMGPSVKHPGLRARRWVAPVLAFNRQKALQAVGDVYTEAIRKAAA